MNTSYEFISAPLLVIERNCHDEPMYWVNEGKRYTPMAAHAFSKFARGKNLEPSEVKHQTRGSGTCVRKVRCIAELKPGLHKDNSLFAPSGSVFLNPYFVPLKKLPAAADLPEEFVDYGNGEQHS